VKRWVRVAGAAAAGVMAAGAAAAVAGSLAWRRASARRMAMLTDEAHRDRGASVPTFSRVEIAGLPASVARYLAFALPEGQRRIRLARVRWTGAMRLRPNAAWSPFTADQLFTTAPPGFVWDARVRMMPLVPVRVRDSYVAGQGRMLGRLGAVVSVVNEGGTPEMAAGALVRWLGEAAWFPTALLPGEGVTWEPVNDSTARATVSDGTTRVSADFHFAPTGEMTGMTAMRYRDVNGTGVLTPFEGRYARYMRYEGLMLPASAEVAWLLPEGRFAYWRGRPEAAEYETAGPARRAPEPERQARQGRQTR